MAAPGKSAFGFQLITPCGDALGTIESDDQQFQPGDTVVLDGIGYWVRSVIPVERVAEFIDAPPYGVLEVEPI
jgi:hypothetical protein